MDYLSQLWCDFFFFSTYWASAGRRGGTGEGNHFLDGQAELEPVQGVADADLSLDLRVWQISHDGAALYVSATRCHVPRRHPDPQLGKTERCERWPPAMMTTLKVWDVLYLIQTELFYFYYYYSYIDASKGARSSFFLWRYFSYKLSWHTSSHVTTVGPSHEANGRPWRQASSNRSCLARRVEILQRLLSSAVNKK